MIVFYSKRGHSVDFRYINVDIELVALFLFGFIKIINGEIQNDFN